MKKSEVVDLLAFMEAYDNRTVGDSNIEAWYLLDVVQRYDLDTCKRAVVLFWNQPTNEYGRPTYLDPSALAYWVRVARREQQRAIDRRRAQLLGSGIRDVDEADRQARLEIEGPPKCICRVRGVADLTCRLHGINGTRMGEDGQL